jgi:hypothetical protein
LAWNDTTNKEHDMMGKNCKQPVVRILKFMIRQRTFNSDAVISYAVISYAMSLISCLVTLDVAHVTRLEMPQAAYPLHW